ncbi:hypothetical protein M378DRAFT_121582 [Amanita muscaria Koide BX008]|uniref:Uncharacterized protein n=1 Tax=Amanita muscaria (strain Koide BX008) TaxID=946122 RepID=A0A0C2XH35_AMAMK|nr:hypothetical protein M378DRAFT_121582 [Amanita muscaria Koide BX008]
MRRLSLRLRFFISDGKKSKSNQVVEITSAPRNTSRPKSPVKLGPSLSRTTSPSSSEYSCDSDTAASSVTREKTTKHARRSSTLSDAGSDRRRLAIVQMETVHEGRSKSASDTGHSPRLRRARPNLTGIAIVAPPDASPSTYTHLSPPLSSTGVDARSAQRTGSKRPRNAKAQRPPLQPQVISDDNNGEPSNSRSVSSVQPLNVRSSASASSSSVNLHSPAIDLPLTTPPIGHSKDIHTPVAGPVVVNLEPSRPLNISKARTKPNMDPPPAITAQSSTDSSGKRGEVPFVHYQPGLHATAGPLPPPPRATFAIDRKSPPPPRPPRTPHPRSHSDIETMKQALQLPPSVSAALASRSHATSELPSPQSVVESSTLIEEAVETKSLHRREGAFVPTPELGNDQMSSTLLQQDLDQENTSAESVTMNETAQLPNIEEHDETSIGSNIVVEPPPRSDSLHTSTEYVIPSHPQADPTFPPEAPSQKPSPPPKSFRNSLTMSLKRFSPLPRPPSGSPRSGKRSSVGTIRTSRTPSPSYPIQHETATQPLRQKVITQNPPGLFCHEVHSIKSASERCSIYAQKINELYNCDTGLVVWLHEAKHRGTTSVPNNPSVPPSTDPFAPQRRHTSGSSMNTEVTFPLRPDATTATDLTSTYRNITPPTVQPPLLPYPSLAISQQQRPPPSTPTSTLRSFATSTPTSTLKGALFASLGRRTSVATSWREKPGITALSLANSQNGGNSSGRNVLMKQPPPPQHSSPRPINVTTSPSVPGGPRAPPNRIKRSQTLMATPAPFSIKSETERVERQSTNHVIPDHIDIKPDPEFTRQVDKLADLLPHADRGILAAYLRRTGQDMLAIGQYLDDEKNGTIRAD